MKKLILGTFDSRPHAQTLIQHLREDLNLPNDDISYIYRNADGDVFEVLPGDEGTEEIEELTSEVKMGSLIGGTFGAVTGMFMMIGAVPVIAPVFAAHTLVMIVGMTVSALGMLAVGGLIGSLIGGVIASLIEKGKSAFNEEANPSRSSKKKSDVLVVAHARDEAEVGRAFTFHGASGVEVYTPTLS